MLIFIIKCLVNVFVLIKCRIIEGLINIVCDVVEYYLYVENFVGNFEIKL